MFEDKFTALESGWQVFFDGFFDHPWASEPNECTRFRDVQVAQHTKGSRNTTKGRVGEEGDIR